MKKPQWIAVCAAALLMFSPLCGCDNQNQDVSPTVAPTPTPTLAPSPEPKPTHEPLRYPDLDGFEKTVNEDMGMVTYTKDTMSILLQYSPASDAAVSEASQGWGTELETLLMGKVFQGEVTSSRVVDLTGLNRKAVELDLFLGESAFGLGLVIPSDGYVITLFCIAVAEREQELRDAYNRLIPMLSAFGD